eukprot:jgi/Psemu1/21185/gm1.21185_g
MNGIHQIWMMMDKLNKGFYDLAEEVERWIDFKQHWNTRLRRLYQAVPLEELEDATENRKDSCRQARRHKRAKKGDESVIARSETYMDTKPHENYMTKLQDGEKKQKIEDVPNNISKITFTPSGNSRGGKKYFKQLEDVWSKGASDCCYEIPQAVKMEKAIQGFFKLNLQKEDLYKAYAEWMEIAGTLEKDMVGRYFSVHWTCRLEGMFERVDQTAQNEREFRASNWKQELKKYFEKLDTYDGIQKVTDPVKKDSIKSALEYIENYKYTPMHNGAEHYFKFMENLFETLKQTNGYNMPIELRMKIKIERKGRKAGSYKEVSSDDNSNENGKAEEDTVKVEEGDESQEERNTHREEEDIENKEGADPIAVAMDPALQKGNTENIEEKGRKTENMERLYTNVAIVVVKMNGESQIAVSMNAILQEGDTDKNQETAANDTDPIAVAADCDLQEYGTENMEE